MILVTPNQVYAGTATYIGGTRSTYVSAFSPLGYKLSAFPHRRMQPFVTGLGGFAVSPRDIPVFNSSSFNYTFEARRWSGDLSDATHAPASWSIATTILPTPAGEAPRTRASIQEWSK